MRHRIQRGQQTSFRQFLMVYSRFCSVPFAFWNSLKPVLPRTPRLSVAVYVVRKIVATKETLNMNSRTLCSSLAFHLCIHPDIFVEISAKPATVLKPWAAASDEDVYAPQGNAQWLSDSHDFVLVYAKNKEKWLPRLLPRTAEMDGRYKNPDNDPRGPWKPVDGTISLSGGQRGAQYAKTGVSANIYELITPSGRKLLPAKGRCWYFTKEKMQEAIADNRIWFGANGNNVPAVKKFLSEVKQGVSAKTIWFRTEVGDNQEAKKEAMTLNLRSIFATPKPERLIERIIHIATSPGDLVLDSFLGSGTTAAVSHKMGRRYIGIEMGNHAYTHCKVRLDKVIAGEDPGGITKSAKWEKGGGYRFYELAPTLINRDDFGEYIINEAYDADMLAAGVALHEGFTYHPDSNLFWKQSVGNEKSYLFVTTRHLNSQYLDVIKNGMEEDEHLIIACCSYDKGIDKAYDHITIKKIPQMLLERCEFGKTDYNLNIVHPPVYEDEEEYDAE